MVSPALKSGISFPKAAICSASICAIKFIACLLILLVVVPQSCCAASELLVFDRVPIFNKPARGSGRHVCGQFYLWILPKLQNIKKERYTAQNHMRSIVCRAWKSKGLCPSARGAFSPGYFRTKNVIFL